MASGGGVTPSSHDDRRKYLECSLCLDIFKDPKLLPCHHSFCCNCLEDLVSRQSSPTFHCPHCRREVTVPAGGVSKFQTNIHINPDDLVLAREGVRCLIHPDQNRDLYCKDCQDPVCLKCVLTRHKSHDTEDLIDAGREARKQLIQDDQRLQKAVSCTTEEGEAERRERQSLQDKKAAVESLIRSKHAAVVAAADKCRDELLARVGAVCRPLEDEVNTAITANDNVLHDLCQLQQQLKQTLTDDSASTLVTMAKEMREGKGSVQSLQNRMPAKRSTISRPVLSSTVTWDTIVDSVRGFLGAVDTVQLKATPPDVKVEKRFTCSKEKDTEVYSVCPTDDGKVWLNYAHCGLQNNAASDKFKEKGEHILSSTRAFGKVSRKCTGNNHTHTIVPSNTYIETYSKSICLSDNYLSLDNQLRGNAKVMRYKITSRDPFKANSVVEFTINVRQHRAFDSDASEQFFAVVEEAQAPDQPRKVKLYQRNQPDAVDTYTPPCKPFNPSDVCFFSMGGEEVLMIADEAGDSVHVVNVRDGRMTFVRHVSPGCPLLVKPTAMNTDIKGRLWVACAEGVILTMTPVTP